MPEIAVPLRNRLTCSLAEPLLPWSNAAPDRESWRYRVNVETLPWKDVITIGLASIGAALGVMNTWNALSQRRVRLLVRPTYAYVAADGPPILSISVTNLSNFPMVVDEVGFTGPKGAKRGKRAMIAQPRVMDGKSWPRRLVS